MEKATNGQFREFIGKLLVKGSDEKVALIDKTKIQNAVNSLSSDDVVMNSFIRFINNGCALQIIGNHEINTDITPNLPFSGATIKSHQKGGVILFDPKKIKFYLSPNQKDGKSIQGHKLRKELEKEPVLNACVLDYLIANPHLIPEEWKKDEKGNTRFIFFWGTIYRSSGGSLCVRCLCFSVGRWQSNCYWLDGGWSGHDPAAVSAS